MKATQAINPNYWRDRKTVLKGMLFVLVALLVSHVASAQPGGLTLIGQNEQVVLTNPETDEQVQVLAKIDTGADRSSVDEELTEVLGLDLEGAEIVTVTSATGEEERPLVDVEIGLAGQTFASTVSVNDRRGLSTDMILGQNDLAGFLVSTAQDQLTSPTDASATEASFLGNLRRALNTDIFTLSAEALFALIPLVAVLVVALRTLVGLKTFGVFAPILIALSFTQTGVLLGSVMFSAVLLTGVLVEPVLRALRLSRTARLAILLTTVILTLFGAKELLNAAALGAVLTAAFPAVVTVAIIEQLWTTWEQEGFAEAAWTSLWTGLVIVLAGFVTTLEPVQMLATRAPLVLAALGIVACVLLGRYRGLRLTELLRFKPAAAADPDLPRQTT